MRPLTRTGLRPWLAAIVCIGVALTAAHAGAATDSHDGSLSIATAALLGALQGATEFLPVSSSGHLALAQHWLGINAEAAGHRFNIVVHAGTLLAVLWLYRTDVLGFVGVARHPTRDTPDRRMLVAVVVATLPLAVLLWPAAEALVVGLESNPRAIGLALLVTATILALSFRGSVDTPQEPSPPPPTLRQALGVGLVQLIAVVPGISRSGSTIGAGLWLGLGREQAARLSFLISIPAIGGSAARELIRIVQEPTGQAIPWAAFAAGFVTSLFVGLLCLRGLLILIRRGKVAGFVIYLAIVGTAAIVTG